MRGVGLGKARACIQHCHAYASAVGFRRGAQEGGDAGLCLRDGGGGEREGEHAERAERRGGGDVAKGGERVWSEGRAERRHEEREGDERHSS